MPAAGHGGLVAGLADKWQGTTTKAMFTLRKGVTCSDGTPLTAGDVAANINFVGDTKNAMSGYIVVKAESHEAAAKLFENHPHFAIFPGESVEIMEVMPIPGR